MRRRTQDPMANRRRLTPNQLVAERIAYARKLRGWTQEEAAERLAPFMGVKWSAVTFSIVERSVDGKRIRQFTADDLVALSRAFQLPIGFWFTPVWTEDDFPLIVTPDAPTGVSTSVLVEVLLGDDAGYEAWANEILDWGASQTLTTDAATGRTFLAKTPLPENKAWIDDLARLRAEMGVAQQFGDLTSAKVGLTRVLALLEILSTIPPPPDRDDTDSNTAKE